MTGVVVGRASKCGRLLLDLGYRTEDDFRGDGFGSKRFQAQDLDKKYLCVVRAV